jgi:hypothetical protein
MNFCDLCYQRTRNRKRNARHELLCNDCRQAVEYYDVLTPEEREADELAMIAYCEQESV